jgi:hypothetical protein
VPAGPSSRGLLVFGQSATFVSHLPTPQPPHNHQVLAEVKILTDPATFNAELFARPNPHGYHTLDPEPVPLASLRELGFRFSATLYAGHFARSGHTRLGPVVVEIKRSIVHREIDGSEDRLPVYQGIVFGDAEASEYYLVHRIGGTPSFDQISLVAAGAPERSAAWAKGFEVAATVHPDQPIARYGQVHLQVDGAPVAIKTRAVYTASELH